MLRTILPDLIAWALLIALLATTVILAEIGLGRWGPVANLSIAAVKTGIVAWVFMHLRRESALVRLFAGAALIWLAILFVLGLSDWLTRGM